MKRFVTKKTCNGIGIDEIDTSKIIAFRDHSAIDNKELIYTLTATADNHWFFNNLDHASNFFFWGNSAEEEVRKHMRNCRHVYQFDSLDDFLSWAKDHNSTSGRQEIVLEQKSSEDEILPEEAPDYGIIAFKRRSQVFALRRRRDSDRYHFVDIGCMSNYIIYDYPTKREAITKELFSKESIYWFETPKEFFAWAAENSC